MNDDLNQVTVSGTVYWYGTHERISGAVLKATSEGKVKLAETDDDGDFKFHNLEPGTWTFVALHEEGRPGRPETKELQQDETNFTFELFRQMGTADEATGRRFFVALCAVLGVLAIAYIVLHVLFPGLEGLFWGEDPWKFLEVIFWAMAGILALLILRTGSSLRWGRFYPEVIFLEIAGMVTIPLLALVLVWLLSLVTLELNFVGDTSLVVDLSNPQLLAAVSFLIGSQPWAAWRLLQETGGKITG